MFSTRSTSPTTSNELWDVEGVATRGRGGSGRLSCDLGGIRGGTGSSLCLEDLGIEGADGSSGPVHIVASKGPCPTSDSAGDAEPGGFGSRLDEPVDGLRERLERLREWMPRFGPSGAFALRFERCEGRGGCFRLIEGKTRVSCEDEEHDGEMDGETVRGVIAGLKYHESASRGKL